MRARRRRVGNFQLVILEYHEVGETSNEPEGTVSNERFRRHLNFLRNRYSIVTMSQAVAILIDHAELSRDTLIITFDDGYSGNYDNAWPVLRGLGIPATVFLTTGFLDTGRIWIEEARDLLEQAISNPRRLSQSAEKLVGNLLGEEASQHSLDFLIQRLKYIDPTEREALIDALKRSDLASSTTRISLKPLGWEQVREMARGGIEFGSHTDSHPILSTLDASDQRHEILRSCLRINEEIQQEPKVFAYPNGSKNDFTDQTVDLLKDHGFEAACTTIRGINRPGADLFRLRRIGVGADSTSLLELRLSGLLDPIHARLSAGGSSYSSE